jgi:hypothetical protein
MGNLPTFVNAAGRIFSVSRANYAPAVARPCRGDWPALIEGLVELFANLY